MLEIHHKLRRRTNKNLISNLFQTTICLWGEARQSKDAYYYKSMLSTNFTPNKMFSKVVTNHNHTQYMPFSFCNNDSISRKIAITIYGKWHSPNKSMVMWSVITGFVLVQSPPQDRNLV
jgi:hypothetical protein